MHNGCTWALRGAPYIQLRYLAVYLLTCLNTTTTTAATTTIITFNTTRRAVQCHGSSSIFTHTHSINCCMWWWWWSPTPTSTSTPTSTPSTAAAAALECMRSLCGLSIDKSHRQRAVAVAVVVAAAVVVGASADSCIYCFARPLALHGVKRAQSTAEKNQLKNLK